MADNDDFLLQEQTTANLQVDQEGNMIAVSGMDVNDNSDLTEQMFQQALSVNAESDHVQQNIVQYTTESGDNLTFIANGSVLTDVSGNVVGTLNEDGTTYTLLNNIEMSNTLPPQEDDHIPQYSEVLDENVAVSMTNDILGPQDNETGISIEGISDFSTDTKPFSNTTENSCLPQPLYVVKSSGSGQPTVVNHVGQSAQMVVPVSCIANSDIAKTESQPGSSSFPTASKTAPLGSSQNPIRIIQQGNQYTSTQQLSPEQLTQIMQVIQEQQAVKQAKQMGGPSVVYNPQTQTKIVYRVINPSDLHSKQNTEPSSLSLEPYAGKKRGRKRKSDIKLEDEEDLRNVPELSKKEKEDKKKLRPKTRSGRVSKPPKHMVKDYKQIHLVDWHEDYDDSDGGYSDYKASDGEDGDGKHSSKRQKADKFEKVEYQDDAYENLRPKKFKCTVCDRRYIGRTGLERHWQKLPDHKTYESVEAVSLMDTEASNDSFINSLISTEATPSADTSSLEKVTTEGGVNEHTAATPVKTPYRVHQPWRKNSKRYKLNDLLERCDDELIAEVCLPKLAKMVSLWEFLLSKLETSNEDEYETTPIYFTEIHKLFEDLRSKVKKAFKDCHVDKDDANSGGDCALNLEITDEESGKALGVDVGGYRVKPLAFDKLDCESPYIFLSANPTSRTHTQNHKRPTVVVPPGFMISPALNKSNKRKGVPRKAMEVPDDDDKSNHSSEILDNFEDEISPVQLSEGEKKEELSDTGIENTGNDMKENSEEMIEEEENNVEHVNTESELETNEKFEDKEDNLEKSNDEHQNKDEGNHQSNIELEVVRNEDSMSLVETNDVLRDIKETDKLSDEEEVKETTYNSYKTVDTGLQNDGYVEEIISVQANESSSENLKNNELNQGAISTSSGKDLSLEVDNVNIDNLKDITTSTKESSVPENVSRDSESVPITIRDIKVVSNTEDLDVSSSKTSETYNGSNSNVTCSNKINVANNITVTSVNQSENSTCNTSNITVNALNSQSSSSTPSASIVSTGILSRLVKETQDKNKLLQSPTKGGVTATPIRIIQNSGKVGALQKNQLEKSISKDPFVARFLKSNTTMSSMAGNSPIRIVRHALPPNVRVVHVNKNPMGKTSPDIVSRGSTVTTLGFKDAFKTSPVQQIKLSPSRSLLKPVTANLIQHHQQILPAMENQQNRNPVDVVETVEQVGNILSVTEGCESQLVHENYESIDPSEEHVEQDMIVQHPSDVTVLPDSVESGYNVLQEFGNIVEGQETLESYEVNPDGSLVLATDNTSEYIQGTSSVLVSDSLSGLSNNQGMEQDIVDTENLHHSTIVTSHDEMSYEETPHTFVTSDGHTQQFISMPVENTNSHIDTSAQVLMTNHSVDDSNIQLTESSQVIMSSSVETSASTSAAVTATPILQTEDGIFLIRNPDGTCQVHSNSDQPIPLETIQALIAMAPDQFTS